jgi:FHA domain
VSSLGSGRQRLAGILNAAFVEGLLSEQTHSYRLGLVFGSRLIDQQRLIGDLTLRGARARSWQQIRATWSVLVERTRSAFGRGAPCAAPLLLALDRSDDERLLVGRDRACDIVLEDPTVSRRHAQLTFRDGVWSIRDLASKNGTFVNGASVIRASLCSGDLVAFGGQPILID